MVRPILWSSIRVKQKNDPMIAKLVITAVGKALFEVDGMLLMISQTDKTKRPRQMTRAQWIDT
jgi:hypothetical protein